LGKKIRFSPLITRKEPKYIIIGADVLIHHPELLDEVFKRDKRISLMKRDGDTLQAVLQSFAGTFKDQVNKEHVCEVQQHQIETGDARPIYCRPSRIPIHFQSQVDNEINRDLDLG
ncbi:hypothetical protein NGRA_3555, partial [Nosema granulosis]